MDKQCQHSRALTDTRSLRVPAVPLGLLDTDESLITLTAIHSLQCLLTLLEGVK